MVAFARGVDLRCAAFRLFHLLSPDERTNMAKVPDLGVDTSLGAFAMQGVLPSGSVEIIS